MASMMRLDLEELRTQSFVRSSYSQVFTEHRCPKCRRVNFKSIGNHSGAAVIVEVQCQNRLCKTIHQVVISPTT